MSKQLSQALLHCSQAPIMAKIGLPPSGYSWLVRIKFPRMKVQDTRLSFLFVNSSKGQSSVLHGEKPQIPPAKSWQRYSAHSHCGQGNFHQRSLRLKFQTTRET